MITGLVTTLMVAPLVLLFLYDGQTRTSADELWFLIVGIIFAMIILGGVIAARWSGSNCTWRCAVLGGVSGGLAGSILFCLLGAAIAGSINFISTDALNAESSPLIIIHQTMVMFLFLFLGGLVFGMLGGLLSRLHKPSGMDHFDLEAPQIALNTSITAVPACLLSVALTAAFFTQHSELPLILSLFLLLVSHFSLTLVIPTKPTGNPSQRIE